MSDEHPKVEVPIPDKLDEILQQLADLGSRLSVLEKQNLLSPDEGEEPPDIDSLFKPGQDGAGGPAITANRNLDISGIFDFIFKLIIGVLAVIILGYILGMLFSMPDPALSKAYEDMSEMKFCILQLEAKREIDATQTTDIENLKKALASLPTISKSSAIPDKIDVVVEDAQLNPTKGEVSRLPASKKAIGLINLDLSH